MKLKPESPKQTYFKKVTSKVVGGIKSVGRKARIAALPLLSSLTFFCASCDSPECRHFNDTTININRVADGEIASLEELERSPKTDIIGEDAVRGRKVILEPLIDFVNETHAIATEGMPSEVNVTLVPKYCQEETDGVAWVPEKMHVDADMGVYTIEPFTLSNVDVLFHEIGHLQGRYGEVMPEINRYEQRLMGFVLFSNQPDGEFSNMIWVGYDAFENDLVSEAWKIEHGGHSDLLEKDKYRRAGLFIISRLSEYGINEGSDFGSLRSEVRGLGSNFLLTVNEVADEMIDSLTPGTSEGAHPSADFRLLISIAHFQEIYRRFGYEAAKAFFDAQSHFPVHGVGSGLAYGLEGRNCSPTKIEGTGDQYCESTPECQAFDATEIINFNITFCCITVEPGNGTPVIRKWRTETSVKTYNAYYYTIDKDGNRVRDDTREVSAEGRWWGQIGFYTITNEVEIDPNGPCH